MRYSNIAVAALCALCAARAPVRAGDGDGELHIPFDTFRSLERELERLRALVEGAPVEAALGQATVRVERDGVVEAALDVEVLGEGWAAVPLLPAGTSVERATVETNGATSPLALSVRGADLVWSVRGAGTRRVTLRYRAVVQKTGAGGTLDVPLPAAAAIALDASLDGEGLDVAVVPGQVSFNEAGGGGTRVQAILPRTSWARLAWARAGQGGALATRASYRGEAGSVGADGGLATIRWKAALDYRLESDAAVWVPVAPGDVAVAEVRVDGRPGTLVLRDEVFHVELAGRGDKVIELTFETAVSREGGPTGTTLWTPRPPIASVALALPGDKEVVVTPAVGVTRTSAGGGTGVAFNLPPTERVSLRWSEALEAGARELRVNAELFHVVRPDEGVLSVSVAARMEVTRGKAQRFVLALPADVVVNAVRGDGISDWRLGDVVTAPAAAPAAPAVATRELVIALDREVSGEHRLAIDLERMVAEAGVALDVPIVTAREVHRQRGMVVIVRGRELEATPEGPVGLTAVGEDQVPEALRATLSERVMHTYKYAEVGAALRVKVAPLVREPARLHATVGTLFSLDEGVLRAAATIDIDAKTGAFVALDLTLPEGVNVLAASAPSLREHRVIEAHDGVPRTLALAFTREMEGNVRVELAWERIVAASESQLAMPLVHVRGAVVEEGQIAVEALTAVEVMPEVVENLMLMGSADLPRALLARTTHPVLHASHYAHADPAPKLTLQVKRHAAVAMQVADIESARYETIVTRDGVAFSVARYRVRNRGAQFLRMQLPAGAEVWSASVSGRAVKAALHESGALLVPLVEGDEAFTIDVVFVTRGDALGIAGTLEVVAAMPDLVERVRSWTVWLPGDMRWGEVDSDMSVAATSEVEALKPVLHGLPGDLASEASWRRITLTKTLANVARRASSISVAYRLPWVEALSAALVLAGGLALGFLLLRLTARGLATSRRAAWGIGLGAGALVLAGGLVGGAWAWLAPAAGLVAVLAGWRAAGRLVRARRAALG